MTEDSRPKKQEIDNLLEVPPAELKDDHGVLLQDKIRMLAEQEVLITEGYDESNVQPASYDLTLGKECYTGTRGRFELTDRNPILSIESYDIAVVSTQEELKLPQYIIGRFNIRIGLIYRGILLVTGPQVDPGYEGKLYTVLYNFSRQPIQLHLDEHVTTIDFIKTTQFDASEIPEDKRFKPTRRTFGDYLVSLQSAPKADLLDRIGVMEKRLEKFIYLQLSIMGGVILAVIAIVLAVVFSLFR